MESSGACWTTASERERAERERAERERECLKLSGRNFPIRHFAEAIDKLSPKFCDRRQIICGAKKSKFIVRPDQLGMEIISAGGIGVSVPERDPGFNFQSENKKLQQQRQRITLTI